MSLSPTIRLREPNDDQAIASIILASFGGSSEVALVNALRRDGDMIGECVAVSNEQIIGHIAFSQLSVTSPGGKLSAAALAPLAVSPDHQNLGTGSALTNAGLSYLKQHGIELVLVLGHPKYYSRFGFSNVLAKRLDAPLSGAAFMALELAPRAIGSQRWTVTYPRAFSGRHS